jgi:L-serine dehydratase
MFTSVLNDVLGPVMRGPSSSHTAGSYHIAVIVRQLLGAQPKKVKISFDKKGSYGSTYVQQGVDQAFATGLMGWKQTDELFIRALTAAKEQGVVFNFEVGALPFADHPNYAIIEVEDQQGQHLRVEAKSVGGGTFRVTSINGVGVHLDGKSFETLLTINKDALSEITEFVKEVFPGAVIGTSKSPGSTIIVQLSSSLALAPDKFVGLSSVINIRQAEPIYFTQKNQAPFQSAEDMLTFADDNRYTLGEAVLEYEKTVLGISEEDAINQMIDRYGVMKKSVVEGLDNDNVDMQLIDATAGTIMDNVRSKRVAIGGLHAKAAAAALAAMHTCNSRGVVCAAPTGGAAGTIPGILTVLQEEYHLSDRKLALMLYAAGGVGLILAIRGTFAAEVAGCQVEIGAAGAMGSAAVVEFAGGTPQQACDAAAISFQNTMGLVCDLVQGMCELPCHTRNGIAASSAFTNADMVMGGYVNAINLDETIDSVYSSGQMLPPELRCTARGGLAIAPSAQNLRRKNGKKG